jgi:hypothetical protein
MMSPTCQRNPRHQPPSLFRRILGWLSIMVGLAMLVLPGPGLLALALGVILLGRRDPLLRRWAVLIRVYVRRLSRAERRTLRWAGTWLHLQHRRARLIVGEQIHRYDHGHSLSPVIRLWIGLTLLITITSLGISLYLLLY